MILVYKNLIDTITGKPLEIKVPDNYQFENKERIQAYAKHQAEQMLDAFGYALEHIPINTKELNS